jgi:hypothetical protein
VTVVSICTTVVSVGTTLQAVLFGATLVNTVVSPSDSDTGFLTYEGVLISP